MSAIPRLPDAIRKPAPDAVRLTGLIGKRFDGSRVNRLHHQEEDHLLWPFQEHCAVGIFPDHPTHGGVRGDWQGEFMGTWIDAAVLSAWNAGDDSLRGKIDHLVQAWLATQAKDGYLGTYDEEDRWYSWDIWVQAHDIIGLMSYYRFTGKKEILAAALRVADRVLADFGAGKRSLRETGPHMGMASSAILEPMIWLYWETGDQRYLDFGCWLVEKDWEGEDGPQIMSSLLNGNGVAGTANAKGIEMLIDFAGLLELYRATGEEKYLRTIQVAWEDIVTHHLYITGSASTGEHFPADFALNNEGIYMIGETCVSMGWLYLNLSLARLTGDARYYDMAEQTLYNHLLAAQSPDGRNWVYYLGLRDSKRYRWHTDPECCPTRGVRAIAHMPTNTFGLLADGISVNFYDASEALLSTPSGKPLKVSVETRYPFEGRVVISLDPRETETFALRLRLPGWCSRYTLKVNGETQAIASDAQGFLVIRRAWTRGDSILFEMEMPVTPVADRLGNRGRVAVTRGPLVFAADSSYLPAGTLLDDVTLSFAPGQPDWDFQVVHPAGTESIHLLARRSILLPQTGESFWREKERYERLAGAAAQETFATVELVPFFEAGNRDERNFREGIRPNNEAVRRITFQVWMPYRCM